MCDDTLDMSPRARFKRAYRLQRSQLRYQGAPKLTRALDTGCNVPSVVRYDRAAINAVWWRCQRTPLSTRHGFYLARALRTMTGRDLWDCIHFIRGY